MDQAIGLIQKVINKLIQWVDQLFAYFGTYSNGYSKYIVWIVLLAVIGKFTKVKFDVSAGKK